MRNAPTKISSILAAATLVAACTGCSEEKDASPGGDKVVAEEADPASSGVQCGDRTLDQAVLGGASAGDTLEGELPAGASKGLVSIRAEVGEKLTFDAGPAENDVSLDLIDLATCKPLRSPATELSLQRVTHVVKEGQDLAVTLRAEKSDEPVPFVLRVVRGGIEEPYCKEHTAELDLGEPQEGELVMMETPNGGPFGNMYQSYSIELEEGQAIDIELDYSKSVMVSTFLYGPDCDRLLPSTHWDDKGKDTDEPFEVPEAGTYTVLVAARNPAGTPYELKVSSP